MTGSLILINGASSSGKSSLVHAMQDCLAEPYLDLGLDRFIFALPKRYLKRPLWDDVLGKADRAGRIGHRLVSGMHHAIAAAVSSGLNVIADHVLIDQAWVAECARLFADVPAYLIGLRCPLHVLEQRERQRQDRTLGQARLQFPLIHKFVTYDLEVDTSILSPQECAARVEERLQRPPAALRSLNPECYNPNNV
jgi:chloramphenicol 3-O phosphotransferase